MKILEYDLVKKLFSMNLFFQHQFITPFKPDIKNHKQWGFNESIFVLLLFQNELKTTNGNTYFLTWYIQHKIPKR